MPRDPKKKLVPSAPSQDPRRMLALGSLALAVLGLALLAYDVATEVQRASGWYAVLGGALGLALAGLWTATSDAPGAPPPRISASPEGHRAIHRANAAPPRRRARAAVTLEQFARWAFDWRKRRWIAIGALIVLSLQALIPLAYYFGDDAYDERFAWRMFSAVRMHECGVGASEVVDGQARPVRLMETIHVGWITTFKRNREASIERYLEWRCEQGGVTSARITSQCTTPDGVRIPPIVRELDCRSGELRREGGL